MNKIVYNACYGGFGLSEAAILRYAELKGIKLYVEKDSFCTYYWTSPEATIKEFEKYKDFYFEREFVRHDPVLVQVIEELGSKKASSPFANISEIVMAALSVASVEFEDSHQSKLDEAYQRGYDEGQADQAAEIRAVIG